MYYLKHPGKAMSALSRSLYGDSQNMKPKVKRLEVVSRPASLLDESPERLKIRVVASCLEKHSPKQYQVRLSAEVLNVQKTSTGLKEGDVIMITYDQDYRHKERLSATKDRKRFLSFPTALKHGDVRIAHLDGAAGNWGKVTGRVYQPAAYQHSFMLAETVDYPPEAVAS